MQTPTSVVVGKATISNDNAQNMVNSTSKEDRQSFESPGRQPLKNRLNDDKSMNIEELSGVKDTPLGRVNDFFKQLKFE